MDGSNLTSFSVRLRDKIPTNPLKITSPNMTGKIPNTSSSVTKVPTADVTQTPGQSSTSPRKISTRANSRGKMIKKAHAVGFEECMSMIGELKDSTDSLYVVFLGAKSINGRNWCPDCTVGEEIFETSLDKMETDAVVIYVDVGERQSWKALDNVWRKDPKLRLTNIPTVIEWKKKLRLEGEQCLQSDIVQMFLGII